ncbi:MAG: transporter [Flavobacteriaceae bacterium]|nr:transporter [Flavobacteriaceae bacterium]
MKNKSLILLFTFFGLSSVLQAQDDDNTPEDLITDRPDATEASTTVPKGSIQIETGAFFTSFEENEIKEEVIGYNTTLVRWGVLENFEFRLGWNFEETRTTVNGMKLDDVQSGFSPLLAGMKVNITEEKGLLPEIALIGHMFFPFSASSDYRPETTAVDFRFSLSHSLSERSSIGYNVGAQWGDDSSQAAYIYTLAYGYSITETFGFYAELYGDLPEDNKANHFWDAGFTFLALPNLQFDATVGQSITEGQDILVSAGASYRIPN